MAMIGRKPFIPGAPVEAGAVDPLAPLPPAQPHFFGQGGAGRGIAGSIGDFLLQLAHMQPIYGPVTQRRQEEQTAFERGEQQYQRRRADQTADSDTAYQHQLQLLDYKRAHPDDQFSQYIDAAGIPEDQRPALYRQKVESMAAPPMMSAMGTDEQGNPVMRFFPRAQAMAPSTAPAPAVGTVKNGYRFKGGNPASPQSWEPAGGASSGSRTFP